MFAGTEVRFPSSLHSKPNLNSGPSLPFGSFRLISTKYSGYTEAILVKYPTYIQVILRHTCCKMDRRLLLGTATTLIKPWQAPSALLRQFAPSCPSFLCAVASIFWFCESCESSARAVRERRRAGRERVEVVMRLEIWQNAAILVSDPGAEGDSLLPSG
jgi:hypothetical protein